MPHSAKDLRALIETSREIVEKDDVENGSYIKFELESESGLEKCNMSAVERHHGFLHAFMTKWPRPPPPKKLLKEAWLPIAPYLVVGGRAKLFAMEEAEKHYMLWTFMWRYTMSTRERLSRSVEVMKLKLAILDAIEENDFGTCTAVLGGR